MTKKTTALTAATVTVAIVAAIALSALSAGDGVHNAAGTAPRIYGSGAPAAAPVTATPRATASDAEDLTRRWTTAFDRASDCPAAAEDRRRIVDLATGQLAEQLAQQPPRPGAQADCHPKRIVAVKAAGPPGSDGVWKVFVQHEGETGGPLTLTLVPTDHGLRVAALDY